MTTTDQALIAGEGTPEAAWQAWPGLHALPVRPPPATGRLVVVAPHPDDEVLACGGLLSLAARAGVPVVVVAVTDGDASHPGSPTLSPADLVARRLQESAAGLARLLDGAPAAQVHRLGLGDGRVAEAEADGRLAAALAPLLAPGDMVAVTWTEDGHPDHEAAGRAVHAAAREVGGAGGARGDDVQVLETLVWTWHWAVPGDPRVPWDRAARVLLDPATAARKRDAAMAHVTQVQPLSDHPADGAVLPPAVLARLLRDVEVLLEPTT